MDFLINESEKAKEELKSIWNQCNTIYNKNKRSNDGHWILEEYLIFYQETVIGFRDMDMSNMTIEQKINLFKKVKQESLDVLHLLKKLE